MRATTFLLNSCDGSQDPITAILDISKEDYEKIREGVLTSAKIDGRYLRYKANDIYRLPLLLIFILIKIKDPPHTH